MSGRLDLRPKLVMKDLPPTLPMIGFLGLEAFQHYLGFSNVRAVGERWLAGGWGVVVVVVVVVCPVTC